jgi:hypothetical protein
MSDISVIRILDNRPVRIDASPEEVVKITNRSGGTLYYKSAETVSSASNDGSIAEGSYASFTAPVYIVSASTTRYETRKDTFVSKGMKRWSTVQASAGETGESTATVAGTVYYGEVKILADALLTGIEVQNGATAETDKLIAYLFDSAGKMVASSKLEGTVSSGAKAYQALAFTSPYAAKAGRYFIGIQGNGTTATLYTLKKGTTQVACGSTTGEFGKTTSITAPTTFTEKVCPFATTY